MSFRRIIQWKEIGCSVLIILILSLLLAFAWLTSNPEQFTLVEGLYQWPLVGNALERWVDRFENSESTFNEASRLNRDPDSGELIPGRVIVHPIDPELTPQVFIPSGKVLYQAPRTDANVLGRTSQIVRRSRLGQDGWWFRVSWQGTEAWVHMPEYADTSNPPLGSAPLGPGPRPSRGPEQALVAMAKSHLISPIVRGYLGPYGFLSDPLDTSLLEEYDRALRALLESYEDWVLAPGSRFEEQLIIFGDLESYESFRGRLPELENLDAPGFVHSGLVVIWTQGAPVARETLLHEVTHLLNRQSLGAFLPPWLDEGLSDFLAESEFDGNQLDPSRLSSYRRDLGGGRFEVSGGEASLMRAQSLVENPNGWTVNALMALDWESFVDTPEALDNYSLSHLLVRYFFLEHPDEFRSWLKGLPQGERATHFSLLRAFNYSTAQLEVEFRRWLSQEKLVRDDTISVTSELGTDY